MEIKQIYEIYEELEKINNKDIKKQYVKTWKNTD